MTKAYFQYYETFENIVQKFPTEQEQNAFRNKIINYGLFGTEPEELTSTENFVWDLIKEMVDDQKHRREVNRANRAKKTTEPVQQELEPQEEKTAQVEEVSKEEEKPKVKKFIKPTTEEVAAYCTERNNGINAQQFVDYYEARGWKIGGNSMKDWKAAVRMWEVRRLTNYRSEQTWPDGKLML